MPEQRKLRCSAGDIVALTPYLLGFAPQDCIVVHGIEPGGSVRCSFHVRLSDPDGTTLAMPDLAGPVLRNDCAAVVLILYGPVDLADPVLSTVADQLDRAEVPILDRLRAAESRYWVWRPQERSWSSEGQVVPEAGIAVTEVVVSGAKAPAPDRDALSDRLELAGPDALAAVQAARDHQIKIEVAEEQPEADRRTDDRALIDRWRRTDALPAADQIAALALAVSDLDVRDQVLRAVATEGGATGLELWIWVLRHAPADLLPNVACVAAFTAYLQGDGLLAKEALARALDADPGHRLSHMLLLAVTEAIPPSSMAAGLSGTQE